MKLDYALTLADYLAAIRLHKNQKVKKHIYSGISVLLFPILAILALAATLVAYSTGQSLIFAILSVPDCVLIIGAIVALYIPRHLFSKMYSGMLSPGRSELIYSLDIDDERILSVVDGVSESKYFWRSIVEIAQDDTNILLYLAQNHYLAIPIHALSLEQRTELNDLVARHLVRSKP
jgi:YcxB-like protein